MDIYYPITMHWTFQSDLSLDYPLFPLIDTPTSRHIRLVVECVVMLCKDDMDM
jgi:hypothetical protein